MLNIIKKLFIPTGAQKEVQELQSWTVKWEIQGESYNLTIINHKVFLKENEADDFIKQLKDSAKFIGTWVRTEKKEN